jgi:hypothetical protein
VQVPTADQQRLSQPQRAGAGHPARFYSFMIERDLFGRAVSGEAAAGIN